MTDLSGCWSTLADTSAIIKQLIKLLFLLSLLAVASLALAQSNSYTLDWWTVDGGGGPSSNSQYALHATMGQPDAGEMSDSRYSLLSGYWDRVEDQHVYLPIVTRR